MIVEYIVMPVVHEDNDGFKPAVKSGWDGHPESFTTEVFVITFEDYDTAMVFARDFAKSKADMIKRSFKHTSQKLSQWLE